MHPKDLSALVEKLDMAYRSGNAQVTDKQFDQLKNRLRKIDPQNSYIQQKMKLLSLDNYCFSEYQTTIKKPSSFYDQIQQHQ